MKKHMREVRLLEVVGCRLQVAGFVVLCGARLGQLWEVENE